MEASDFTLDVRLVASGPAVTGTAPGLPCGRRRRHQGHHLPARPCVSALARPGLQRYLPHYRLDPRSVAPAGSRRRHQCRKH